MEKNVYQILQDWHELLKSGVITDEEFAAKKKELLGGQKRAVQNPNQEDVPIIRTLEEQVQYDAEYELLINKKSWLQKNKWWLIGLGIAIIASVLIWNNYRNSNNGNINLETKESGINSGYFVTNTDSTTFVYFYKEASINTRKAAYLLSPDTVYVEKVKNGFGYIEYTNERQQTTKGWVQMQDLEYCSNCGNFHYSK